MKNPPLGLLVKKELGFSFILLAVFFAFLYTALVLYLLNFSLVKNTVIDATPLTFKLNLLLALLGGAWTAFSPLDRLLSFSTAVLFGANLALIISTAQKMKDGNGIKVIFGGGTLLSIVSAGCTSCGFSLLSILGISGALSLPFHGIELHIISLLLLFLSFFYMLRRFAAICKIRR